MRASCESAEPECALHKGRKHSFVALLRVRTGAKHRLTAIGLQSSNVSFNAFVRMARSQRGAGRDRHTVRDRATGPA